MNKKQTPSGHSKDVHQQETKYDVFLSYAVADREIALELEARLKATGLTCYMAEKMPGGVKWLPEIRTALRASARVLLLITPRSIRSIWVMLETGAAWMEDIQIVPIVQFVDPSEMSDIAKQYQAIPIETEAQKTKLVHHLAGIHTGDISELTFEKMLEKLRLVKARHEQDRFHPNLFIGSGRDGAVCAGILAELYGHAAIKVVDCHFDGTGKQRVTQIDGSSLRREDIFGKNVLIVEWVRQTGATFNIIRKQVARHGPAGLHSYAMFWTRHGTPPDCYGYAVNSVPASPWGRL